MAASLGFPKIPEGWQETNKVSENGQIFLRIYHKKNLNRGRTLFLVHGQAEQSDRYEHFPFYLNPLIDVVAAVDLPGHGKSQGVRGHIEHFDDYSKAVLMGFQMAKDWVESQGQKPQMHWFGHSLGGLISLRTLLKHQDLPLKSVTISAPLLDLAFPVPKVKKFFGELVEPILGSLKLDNELNSTNVSHDPGVIDYYRGNPLNHHYVTPRFFVNMTKEMSLTKNNQGPFAYPLQVILPFADNVVSSTATLEFFKNLKMAPGKEKILTGFPGFYHESFNEIGKERAFLALQSWISKFCDN